MLAEVVLRDPRRGEASALGLLDLLEREAVAVGGGRVFEQAGEEPESGAGHACTSSDERSGSGVAPPRPAASPRSDAPGIAASSWRV